MLANVINEYDVKELNVYGHASTLGTRVYNLHLSQLRAESVAKVLNKKFTIDNHIIYPIGKGETQLINKAETKEAHHANRRVEMFHTETHLQPIKK